tara:strand:- start:107 stop:472 length:366 start_codon:yes stop_codon:yes gene_type:complete
MERTYSLSSGILNCFPTYAIFDFTAERYDLKEAKEFGKVIDTHYKGRKCVVISTRKLTKSINPEVYTAVTSKSVIAIAIVSENEAVRKEAVKEQSLCQGAFSYFKTIDEAVNWADTVVKNS